MQKETNETLKGGDYMDPKVLFILVAAAAVGVGTVIKKRKS